ncbi:MAG: hypothetical protein JNM77_00160 [Pseudonocardia sp.]|nr:hypothetical protein [Pseudonocardia sp.]
MSTKTFHNPYNFIPALPRTDLPAGLADGPPPGHHRWHDDRWSGEIDVRLEVVTPLLLTRVREAACGVAGHRELEIATTADDRLDLPPSQLKGMLRSAYEAVTCSRFGVLDRRAVLGFRSVADGAVELQPALVEAADRVTVLGRIDGLRAAATVALWRKDPRRTRLHPHLAHGDVVDAVIRRGPHAWEVVSLHRPGAEPADGLVDGHHLVRGHLHATGPSVKDKHAGTVFVTGIRSAGLTQDEHRVIRGREAESLVEGLATLIAHQRDVHRPAGGDRLWAENRTPWDYLGHEPGKTAWSRHLYDLTDTPDGVTPPPYLGPDTVVPPSAGTVVTCWAETADVDLVRRELPPRGATTVERLRPVLISRLLHIHAPGELLDESLRPARTLDQLPPADRVFGWTWDGQGTRPEPSAHRSALRIVGVRTPRADDTTATGSPVVEDLDPLVLPPLSTPKPSQGRFYLAKKPRRPGDPPGPLDAGTDRYGFFQPASQTLRGRKVYPHHRALEGLDTRRLRSRLRYEPPVVDRRRRPERDSQNATLHQWINPGAVVTFTVRVTDLHALELGALLWLLDPACCGSAEAPGRHRLGGGRPLGFGSVELTVAGTRLYRGDRMRDRLLMLEPEVDADVQADLAAEFEKALPASARPVLEALRWAFTGFGRNAPVHYPRNRKDGPAYEWFVENEKVRSRAAPGRRQALPLPGEVGLSPNG